MVVPALCFFPIFHNLHIPLLDVLGVPLGLGLNQAGAHAVAVLMLLLLPERAVRAHAVMPAVIILVAIAIRTISVLLILLVASSVVLTAVPAIVAALIPAHVLLLVVLLLIVPKQGRIRSVPVLQVVLHFVRTVAIRLDPKHQQNHENDGDQSASDNSDDHRRSLFSFGVDSPVFVFRRHSCRVVVVRARIRVDLGRRSEHWRRIRFRFGHRRLRNVVSRLVVVVRMVVRMVDRVVVLVADCARFSRDRFFHGVNHRRLGLRRDVGRREARGRRGGRA